MMTGYTITQVGPVSFVLRWRGQVVGQVPSEMEAHRLAFEHHAIVMSPSPGDPLPESPPELPESWKPFADPSRTS